MINFKKITSVALAAAMMLSVASFSSSAAAKKAVNSENTAKGVKISWKETKKAGKYQVLRSTSKNKGFKVIGSTKKTTFTDKKAKNGKTYYYTVKATKAKAAYKTEKAVRLTAPTLKKVVAQETGNLVTVKWSKVKGAKAYSVYYAKVKANGKVGKYEEYFTVDGTKTDVYLEKEGTYSFKIAAVKGSSKSAFSKAKTIDFVPTPDVVVTVGEKDDTLKNAIDFIKAMLALVGEDIEITVDCTVENPEIASVDEEYMILGLAAGETTVTANFSYTVEGETISEPMTLKVLVKEGEATQPTDPEEPTVTDYVGDYVYSDKTDVTISIKGTFEEDNSFEMITTAEGFKSVVSGKFKFGVTDTEEEIKLILVPHKSVTEANGETTVDEDMSDVEPFTASIVGNKLTLVADGTETVFTKVENTTPSEPSTDPDPTTPSESDPTATDPSETTPSETTPSETTPSETTVVEVKGDFEVALTSEDGVIYTGSIDLEDGDYEFSVFAGEEKLMFYTIGSEAEEGIEYTWGINFVNKAIKITGADKGTYTFTYDSANNTFSMKAVLPTETTPVVPDDDTTAKPDFPLEPADPDLVVPENPEDSDANSTPVPAPDFSVDTDDTTIPDTPVVPDGSEDIFPA